MAEESKYRVLIPSEISGPGRRLAELSNGNVRFEAAAVDANDCTLSAQILRHTPQIVIHDFIRENRKRFPALEGIAALFGDTVRAIAFTDCSDYETAHAFFRSGGWGYVLKSCPEEEILDAVRSVAKNKRYLCPHIGGEHLKDEPANPARSISGAWETLTPSESEIARYLEQGFTVKAIAENRNRSIRTVQTQVLSIRKKLGIKHIYELMRK